MTIFLTHVTAPNSLQIDDTPEAKPNYMFLPDSLQVILYLTIILMAQDLLYLR